MSIIKLSALRIGNLHPMVLIIFLMIIMNTAMVCGASSKISHHKETKDLFERISRENLTFQDLNLQDRYELFRSIADNNPESSRAFRLFCEIIPEEYYEVVLPYLESSDWVDRDIATRFLCTVDPKLFRVETFFPYLESPYLYVSSAARKILNGKDLVSDDPQIMIRYYIGTEKWEEIRKYGETAAVPLVRYLKRMLPVSQNYRQYSANNTKQIKSVITLLGEAGKPVEEELVKLFADSSLYRSGMILKALVKLNWKPNDFLQGRYFLLLGDYKSFLQTGSSGIKWYLHMRNLFDKEDYRKQASVFVKNIHQHRDFLIELLSKSEIPDELRENILYSLSIDPSEKSLSFLIDWLFSMENDKEFIGKIQDELSKQDKNIEQRLLKYLTNGDGFEIRRSIRILAKLKSKIALKIFQRMLDQEDEKNRHEILTTITVYPHDDVLPVLRNLMYSVKHDDRDLLISAIDRYGKKGREILLSSLNHENIGLRSRIYHYLKEQGWQPSSVHEKILSALITREWAEFRSYGVQGNKYLEKYIDIITRVHPLLNEHFITGYDELITNTLIPENKELLWKYFLKMAEYGIYLEEGLEEIFPGHENELYNLLIDDNLNPFLKIYILGYLAGYDLGKTIPYIRQEIDYSDPLDFEKLLKVILKTDNKSLIQKAVTRAEKDRFLLTSGFFHEFLIADKKELVKELAEKNKGRLLRNTSNLLPEIFRGYSLRLNDKDITNATKNLPPLILSEVIENLVALDMEYSPEILKQMFSVRTARAGYVLNKYLKSKCKNNYSGHLLQFGSSDDYILRGISEKCFEFINKSEIPNDEQHVKPEQAKKEYPAIERMVRGAIERRDTKTLRLYKKEAVTQLVSIIEGNYLFIAKNRMQNDVNVWYPNEDFLRAFQLIGEIADSDVLPVISYYLRSDNLFCRCLAAKVLRKMNWQPQTEEDRILYAIANYDIVELYGSGQNAVLYLLDILQGDKYWCVNEHGCATEDNFVNLNDFAYDYLAGMHLMDLEPYLNSDYYIPPGIIKKTILNNCDRAFGFFKQEKINNNYEVFKALEKCDSRKAFEIALDAFSVENSFVNRYTLDNKMREIVYDHSLSLGFVNENRQELIQLGYDLLVRENTKEAKTALLDRLLVMPVREGREIFFPGNVGFENFKTDGKLKKYLESQDEGEQLTALTVLEQTLEREYVKELRRLAVSSSRYIRLKASNILSALNCEPASEREFFYRHWDRENYSGILGMRKEAIPFLKDLTETNSQHKKTPFCILRALGWEPETDYWRVASYIVEFKESEILQMGSRAVAPLIKYYKNHHEDAYSTLGIMMTMKDLRFVEPLLYSYHWEKSYDDSSMPFILEEIIGERPATTQYEWQAWWKKNKDTYLSDIKQGE